VTPHLWRFASWHDALRGPAWAPMAAIQNPSWIRFAHAGGCMAHISLSGAAWIRFSVGRTPSVRVIGTRI